MKLIGGILCEMVCLRRSQLEEALEEQKGGDRLLGQILVDHGYVTEIQLRSALQIQKKTNMTAV